MVIAVLVGWCLLGMLVIRAALPWRFEEVVLTSPVWPLILWLTLKN